MTFLQASTIRKYHKQSDLAEGNPGGYQPNESTATRTRQPASKLPSRHHIEGERNLSKIRIGDN
jgi:hypothetical protein